MSEYKYQSPIELIQSEMKMRVEDGIVKAVQDVGVNVDKDELLKALAYDRDQYNKGYHDAEPKVGRWIENETTYADNVRQTCECSVCGKRSPRPLGDYCRWCGAKMIGE